MKPIIILLVLLLVYLQYRLWIGDGNLPDVIQLDNEVEAQREAPGRWIHDGDHHFRTTRSRDQEARSVEAQIQGNSPIIRNSA